MKLSALLPGLLVILFFSLCLYFAKKTNEGPWHSTVTELWKQEDWQKLRALGQNLHTVGKDDVEVFYVGMHAAEQMKDFDAVQFFAAKISESRVLNWKMESRVATVYRPQTLRKSVALFRTRIIFGIAAALVAILLLSLSRKEPLRTVPAILAAAGMMVFFL